MVLTLDRPLPAETAQTATGDRRPRPIGYGLDFFDTIFETASAMTSSQSSIAALGGFPNRYPHWRFGMEFEQTLQGI